MHIDVSAKPKMRQKIDAIMKSGCDGTKSPNPFKVKNGIESIKGLCKLNYIRKCQFK